jgi:hypothetical protein
VEENGYKGVLCVGCETSGVNVKEVIVSQLSAVFIAQFDAEC